MHPQKFFGEVEFREVHYPGVIDKGVREYMKDVHPSQFIDAEIDSVLYEVRIHYVIKKNRWLEAKKYLFLQPHDDLWVQVDCILRRWIEKQGNKLGKDRITDFKIDEILEVGKAVLKIG